MSNALRYMDVNTLQGYTETVIGAIDLRRGFFESRKSYQNRVIEVEAKLYASFENVAKGYHKIALQNFILLAENKCKDRDGKRTKKLNFTEIFNISENVKFKP